MPSPCRADRGCLLAVVALATACGRLGFEVGSGTPPPDGSVASVDGPAAGADAATLAADASGPSGNLIWLTQTVHTGALGGLAGADDLCANEASLAGLTGTFGAVLWSGAGDPAIRLGASAPFVDAAGTLVARLATDLTDGRLYAPVRRDLAGTLLHDTSVWFGNADAGQRCGDWTAATGVGGHHDSDAKPSGTTTAPNACATARRVMCAQRGIVIPIPEPVLAGRRAFITDASWTPGGGRSSADALCASEATAAGLPATFLAFLADAGVAAEARFDGAGLPWHRVGSVALAPTAADLVGPMPMPYLDGFVAGFATGEVEAPIADILWMGTSTSHCSGWASTAGTVACGNSATTDRSALTADFAALPCGLSGGARLLCLEP